MKLSTLGDKRVRLCIRMDDKPKWNGRKGERERERREREGGGREGGGREGGGRGERGGPNLTTTRVGFLLVFM